MSKRALGKGLDALFQPEEEQSHPAEESGRALMIPIDRIDPSPEQPRTHFDQERLDELTASIRHQGVIQPIIVEAREERFSIVAGERRFRAAGAAGLSEIPAIVAKYGEEKRLLVSLIENLQREDLDPIEEADAFRALIERTNLSQEGLAEQIGRSRAAVANSLRLLNLSDEIKEAIRARSVSAGHARALLSVLDGDARDRLFRRIVDEGISVREAELEARRLSSEDRPAGKTRKGRQSEKTPDVQRVEEQFIEALGTKVRLKGSLSKGTVEIAYFSKDDLERLYELFVRE